MGGGGLDDDHGRGDIHQAIKISLLIRRHRYPSTCYGPTTTIIFATCYLQLEN